MGGEPGAERAVAGGVHRELEREQAPLPITADRARDAGDGLEAGRRRLLGLEGARDLREPPLVARVEDGEEEIVLAREVRVDSPLGVAGVRGDLLERARREAPTREDARGGLDDADSRLFLLLRTCEPDTSRRHENQILASIWMPIRILGRQREGSILI